MDDAAQIDRLIEVMQELQGLVDQLHTRYEDTDLILGMIVALIITTQIPNVTILPNIREEVAYA
jgi:hypothetical protein|tara:strand:- start:4957 stop:5148 length:192 start_codon:yes stop_codon:yes gene_type:complete